LEKGVTYGLDSLGHNSGGDGNGSTFTYKEMCWRHDEQLKALTKCQEEVNADVADIRKQINKLYTQVAILPNDINLKVHEQVKPVMKQVNYVLVSVLFLVLGVALNLYFKK